MESWPDMRHPIAWRIWLCAACCLLGACDPPAAEMPRPSDRAPQVLKRGNGGDPGSLDPALAQDVHAFNVLLDLYEGLLTAGSDGSIGPGVASDWEVSPDGRTYRFTLRADAVWSNGQPVIADHFVQGIRHAVRPGSQSANAFLLEPIANYRQVLEGSAPPESLGVRAAGERTLIIELDRPTPWFPGILTMPVALPRLPVVHDDPESFRRPGSFVGNGPYVLQEWQPGSDIKLRRNESFHSAGQVAIPFVHHVPVTDPTAEFNRYRAGELHITATVPPAAIAKLRAEYPRELQVAPGIGLYYLAFDLAEPPFDDRRLRQALSMAIDRDRLVELLGRGELPAYGLVPPGVHGHSPYAYAWSTEPAATRERLARGTLPPGAATAPIRLTYDAGDVHEDVALAVRAMWQDVLGVEVRLQRLEWKAFLDLRGDRAAWQVMRFSWIGDFDDASTFLDLFVSDSAQNLPGYRNARYDGLMRQAAAGGASPARRRLLADAERTLMEDYAIVPLYFYVNKHLVSTRLAGFEPNLLDRHPSRYLSFRSQ